jgi:hypothetical protein
MTFKSNQMKLYLSIFLALMLTFCSSPTKENDQPEEVEEAEQTEEAVLTYMQLYDLVIQQTGERIEWHGEELDKSGAEFLTISKDGVCGENDCGTAVYLENSSENQIEVVVQAPFQIGDDTGELATKYIIDANDKISIGCSHLCFDGEGYLLERRIVGAKIN